MNVFTLSRPVDQGTSEIQDGANASRTKYKRYEARPLCIRCPPSLEHNQTNPIERLCRHCGQWYWEVKRKEGNPLLSVEEFIRHHPSRFLPKGLCSRCPTLLGRVAKKNGMCHSCGTAFCAWKKKRRLEGLEASDLTVARFIKECPGIYARNRTSKKDQ